MKREVAAVQSFACLKSTMRWSFFAAAEEGAAECGQEATCGSKAILLSGRLRIVKRPLQRWQRSTASDSLAASRGRVADAEAKSECGVKRFMGSPLGSASPAVATASAG